MSRPPVAELELELLQFQLIRRLSGDNDQESVPGSERRHAGWGWGVGGGGGLCMGYTLVSTVYLIRVNLQQKEVGDARGTEGEQEAKWTSSSVAGPTRYPLHMHRRRGAERHVLHILFAERS